MNYNNKQKETANRVLSGYAGKETTFSSDHYQNGRWIFKAVNSYGTYFVIVGVRGGIIDNEVRYE